MKRVLLLTTTLAAFSLLAHDEPKGKPITITGTVVDTGCYMAHEGKGAEHAKCAETCAKGGIPLAILDAGGKLYLPVATDHKNPNLKLMPFIEKRVKVSGTSLEKPGINGIAIKEVVAAE